MKFIRLLVLILFLGGSPILLVAQDHDDSFARVSISDSITSAPAIKDELGFPAKVIQKTGLLDSIKGKEPKRLVAIGLTILLGPFGVHRLYLGTKPRVPIVYTLTLGGGLGVLPLLDLVHLIIYKDLSRFKNNPHVFIWKKGEE